MASQRNIFSRAWKKVFGKPEKVFVHPNPVVNYILITPKSNFIFIIYGLN